MKRTRTTSSRWRAAKATSNRVVGTQARQDAMIARRVAALQRRNGGQWIGCCEKLCELDQRACTGYWRNCAAAVACARGTLS